MINSTKIRQEKIPAGRMFPPGAFGVAGGGIFRENPEICGNNPLKPCLPLAVKPCREIAEVGISNYGYAQKRLSLRHLRGFFLTILGLHNIYGHKSQRFTSFRAYHFVKFQLTKSGGRGFLGGNCGSSLPPESFFRVAVLVGIFLILLIAQVYSADNRLYATIYSECAGCSQAEQLATIAVYHNLIKKYGYEKALLKSCAYKFKSAQYRKAIDNSFTIYEKRVYALIKKLIDSYDNSLPYLAHENIKRFGVPKWAKDYAYFKDIGTSRFYWN